MAGFSWVKSLTGTRDIRRTGHVIAAVSTTFTKGDALKFTGGKLAAAGTTDVVEYIADATKTTAASDEETLDVIKVDGNLFLVSFTPLLNDIAVNSGSTTTALAALTDGTSDDLKGGLVYCKETGDTRIITANTYSSNVVTITVGKAFSRALTSSDTIRVVPFGYGSKAVQLSGASTIATTRAAATGGKVAIYGVSMAKKQAEVFFIPA